MEKLRNAEDKLDAAEKVKLILQSEIKTYEEINRKISQDLEVSFGENEIKKRSRKNEHNVVVVQIHVETFSTDKVLQILLIFYRGRKVGTML